MTSGERRQAAAGVIRSFYAAMRDRRIEDLLALLDPKVACFPVTRPGQPVYSGHAAMVKLVSYVHQAHGNYQYTIDHISEQARPSADGPRIKVTVQMRVFPEPGEGRPQMMPVTTEFTVQDGLITWIVSKPGNEAPTAEMENVAVL